MSELSDMIRARGYGRRSAAYKWLRDSHAEITAMIAELAPTWRTLAEVMSAKGVRGARGQVVVPEDFRRMWLRVCRDIEAAETANRHGLPPRKKQPRDLPKNWTPPLADPTPASQASANLPVPISGGTDLPANPSSENSAEKALPETVQRALRFLAQRSGR